ncbi:MAG: hypothetical protein IRZ33_08630 [Alicyclobacillaceae bacterium]|nr:hypothetical protein [Alicyclobacillaceae bacterium]
MKHVKVYQVVAWAVIAIAAIVVVTFFIKFLLEVAVLAALVALAYYWFVRATQMRRRDKPWR